MLFNLKVFILQILNGMGLYTKGQMDVVGKDLYIALRSRASLRWEIFDLKEEKTQLLKETESKISELSKDLEYHARCTDTLTDFVNDLSRDLESAEKKVEILTKQLIKKASQK
jgi:septal ring factor EnvC (AmiA/AmiB activator)